MRADTPNGATQGVGQLRDAVARRFLAVEGHVPVARAEAVVRIREPARRAEVHALEHGIAADAAAEEEGGAGEQEEQQVVARTQQRDSGNVQ